MAGDLCVEVDTFAYHDERFPRQTLEVLTYGEDEDGTMLHKVSFESVYGGFTIPHGYVKAEADHMTLKFNARGPTYNLRTVELTLKGLWDGEPRWEGFTDHGHKVTMLLEKTEFRMAELEDKLYFQVEGLVKKQTRKNRDQMIHICYDFEVLNGYQNLDTMKLSYVNRLRHDHDLDAKSDQVRAYGPDGHQLKWWQKLGELRLKHGDTITMVWENTQEDPWTGLYPIPLKHAATKGEATKHEGIEATKHAGIEATKHEDSQHQDTVHKEHTHVATSMHVWVQYWDSGYKRWYYHNHETSVSVWQLQPHEEQIMTVPSCIICGKQLNTMKVPPRVWPSGDEDSEEKHEDTEASTKHEEMEEHEDNEANTSVQSAKHEVTSDDASREQGPGEFLLVDEI